MKALSFIVFFTLINSPFTFGQSTKISGEIRPRFEARNGYKKPVSSQFNTAAFVSQRTRLNFDYNQAPLQVKITVQNVRVWGDISTLSLSDKNGLTLHETWAKYFFNSVLSLKVGRQEIVYDNHRIFGSVGWAQQARSHDAALLIFNLKKKGKLELGLAYNANRESVIKENYTQNQYKTFQYAWANFPIKTQAEISFLALNNGLPFLNTDGVEEIAFSQTFGTYFKGKKGKLSADAWAYYQTGWLVNTLGDHKQYQGAINVAANVHFQFAKSLNIGIGGEYLSGNAAASDPSTNMAFNPYYGTNHKFNGLMDYFYVGNHINSVGLIDINLPLKYSKEKLTIVLNPHYFIAAAEIPGYQTDLGTEIDLTGSYKFNATFALSAGYSHLIQTNNLVFLKGGDTAEINNWAWLMLTFKPVFYSTAN